MNLNDLVARSGEWLRGEGPQSDIVISSRIRLARNLADFPFVRRCHDVDRTSIEKLLRSSLTGIEHLREHLYVDVQSLSPIDRQLLVERQMISRELADGSGARGALIGNDETFSVMINEEDHVRLQVMHSGLALETAWNRINELDDWLESKANYAFHERLGYLTACPTNVGTGMRVSVLLHLPALVMAKQIDKVFRSLQKISLAVRGLYGEGSQATGDFYQISNQITLGRTESELIKQVTDVVPVIIDYERQARGFLMKEGHKDVHDRVSRAFGLLCTAQTITSEETMQLLSSVRLGVNMGLISDVEIPTINKLFLQTQPAHLQKLSGVEMTAGDGNTERAVYLQRHLRKQDSQAGQN